jgi:hypothetical protein
MRRTSIGSIVERGPDNFFGITSARPATYLYLGRYAGGTHGLAHIRNAAAVGRFLSTLNQPKPRIAAIGHDATVAILRAGHV